MADDFIELDMSQMKRLRDKLIKTGVDIKAINNTATKTAVLFVQSNIPPYPSPPPDSTYRRTGQLGRSLTAMQGRNPDALSRVESTLFGDVGYVGTRTKYSPYVVDQDRQARVHKGRWYTLQQVLRNSRAGIVMIYKKAYRAMIKKRF